jgi:serralysin
VSKGRSYDNSRVDTTTFTNGVRSTYLTEDLGDAFAWTSIERTYGATGSNILQEIRINDDGRADTKTYDADGVTLSIDRSFANGREDTTTFTDGVRSTLLIEDLGNVFAWDSIERTYGATGSNKLQEIRINDNGRAYTTEYDAEGVTMSRAIISANGRADTTTFIDGVRSTHLIEDLGNVFAWDSISRTYDAEGRNLQQIRTNDDGRTDTTQYDVAGMTFSQSIAYADGRVSLSTFIDGQAETINYDAEGMKLSQSITYEDGREELTTFTDGVRSTYSSEDNADAFVWESIERTYDATGRDLQEIRINDDGISLVSDFVEGILSQTVGTDIDNMYDYSSYTDTFNADGDRVTRTMTNDDDTVIFTSYLDDIV